MQIRLQSLISGFSGKPAMVYAFYDTELEQCIIGKVGRSKDKKQSGSVLISVSDIPEVDDRYEEIDIKPSISDYYALLKSGCLEIKEDVQEANPERSIEFEGLKGDKKEYRVMPDMKNSQIAVLSICRHIQKSKKAEQAIDFMDNFFALSSGAAVTI